MKITKEQSELIKYMRQNGNTYQKISDTLGICISSVRYHSSEENKKKMTAHSLKYFAKLSPEKKKEVWKRRSKYISSYIKKRYHSDKAFRKKVIASSKRYYQKKKAELKP